MTTDTSAAPAPGTSPAELTAPPLFYSRPEPLLQVSHKDVKIRPDIDYSFAAATNTVPVTVPEFTLISRHYPIIFLGPELVPTAALGFSPEVNLFVNPKGEWANGHYVPAYVRRYPFILLGMEGDDRLHLGMDAAGVSTKPGARPLFDGLKETPALTQAITLCEQFHTAYMFTRDFSKALKDADIIEERSLEAETSPGNVTNVGTFARVNEEKFKALPDATILEWHKNGFLYGVYFHLQSMNNWDLLFGRNAQLLAAAAQVA